MVDLIPVDAGHRAGLDSGSQGLQVGPKHPDGSLCEVQQRVSSVCRVRKISLPSLHKVAQAAKKVPKCDFSVMILKSGAVLANPKPELKPGALQTIVLLGCWVNVLKHNMRSIVDISYLHLL